MLAVLISTTENTKAKVPLRNTKEKMDDIKNACLCTFKSTPAQIEYRKRIIEIWEEFDKFNTTNRRLTNEARLILQKGWFSDVDKLEKIGTC